MAEPSIAPAAHRTRFSHRRYWLFLYNRDVPAAERFIEEALRHWPPRRIYLRVFEPALNLSGTLWASGTINPADEHFITHHTVRFMRRVRRECGPANNCGPLAVATGVDTDSHQIGLRMVCDFLGWANWRVHWLSSNDRATVGDVVGRLRPDALLLSLGTEAALASAARLIADLRRRNFGGLIAVGGRAINAEPARAERVGADLTASNGAALVRALRSRFPNQRWRRQASETKETR